MIAVMAYVSGRLVEEASLFFGGPTNQLSCPCVKFYVSLLIAYIFWESMDHDTEH
jgi:hypothetical protein